MAHDVFISHSVQDKTVFRRVVHRVTGSFLPGVGGAHQQTEAMTDTGEDAGPGFEGAPGSAGEPLREI